MQLANKHVNCVRRERMEQGKKCSQFISFSAGIYLYKSSVDSADSRKIQYFTNNICLVFSIIRYLRMFSHYYDRSCNEIYAFYLCMWRYGCQVYKSVHVLIAACPSVYQHSLFKQIQFHRSSLLPFKWQSHFNAQY